MQSYKERLNIKSSTGKTGRKGHLETDAGSLEGSWVTKRGRCGGRPRPRSREEATRLLPSLRNVSPAVGRYCESETFRKASFQPWGASLPCYFRWNMELSHELQCDTQPSQMSKGSKRCAWYRLAVWGPPKAEKGRQRRTSKVIYCLVDWATFYPSAFRGWEELYILHAWQVQNIWENVIPGRGRQGSGEGEVTSSGFSKHGRIPNTKKHLVKQYNRIPQLTAPPGYSSCWKSRTWNTIISRTIEKPLGSKTEPIPVIKHCHRQNTRK